jgi:phosphoribosylformylglycinamidine synthase
MDDNVLSEKSSFPNSSSNPCFVLEVGPRLNFQTAWSSNAVTIFHSCGIGSVERIERSRRLCFTCCMPIIILILFRYYLEFSDGDKETLEQIMKQFTSAIHDRMTEMVVLCLIDSCIVSN